MTELKTLKDFEDKKEINGEVITRFISADSLKQEAIKWVKYFNNFDPFKGNYKEITEMTGMDGDFYEKGLVVQVFIKFFNITEEDLK